MSDEGVRWVTGVIPATPELLAAFRAERELLVAAALRELHGPTVSPAEWEADRPARVRRNILRNLGRGRPAGRFLPAPVAGGTLRP